MRDEPKMLSAEQLALLTEWTENRLDLGKPPDVYDQLVSDALDHISALEAREAEALYLLNPWTSVEDGLPENYGKYLVQCRDGWQGHAWFDDAGAGHWELMEAAAGQHIFDVTHWMPLPEPPTMEESE